ncbi:predicted protein [Nematostella vectensis]|uniref:Uncharacterized protein n=1 Tax=Nematostella vectensis TaxID=45351 RepID=A7SP49_NEMVE|nr:uncharacterized protein LOC5505860 isoform X2 [Nematostella vectensis]EDO34512.1 predicted protein [Nematostella vectensis]|eukprot:XP_001626612.1 predicted protein [Nematostella vectensis]
MRHHHSAKKELEKTINVLKEEITRLHNDLRQTKGELKLEKTRTMDLTMAVQEKDSELFNLQKDFDQQMQAVTSALLILESDIRKEQKEIQLDADKKDYLIRELTEELRKRELAQQQEQKVLETLKSQHDKEIKVRDKRIASQWREIESLKNANTKFLDALAQFRPNTDGLKMQRNASTGSLSINRPRKSSEDSTPHRLRLAVSPNSRRKVNNPEWKEELSAFF